jgi:hypothetical protein
LVTQPLGVVGGFGLNWTTVVFLLGGRSPVRPASCFAGGTALEGGAHVSQEGWVGPDGDRARVWCVCVGCVCVWGWGWQAMLGACWVVAVASSLVRRVSPSRSCGSPALVPPSRPPHPPPCQDSLGCVCGAGDCGAVPGGVGVHGQHGAARVSQGGPAPLHPAPTGAGGRGTTLLLPALLPPGHRGPLQRYCMCTSYHVRGAR